MLDQLYSYLESEDARLLIFALLWVGGAIIGVNTGDEEKRISRLPFLIFAGFALIALSVSRFAIKELTVSVAPSALWLVILLGLSSTAVFGFWLGRLAVARCRDAFDTKHKLPAIIATAAILFSQIAYFVLALKGTREQAEYAEPPLAQASRKTNFG